MVMTACAVSVRNLAGIRPLKDPMVAVLGGPFLRNGNKGPPGLVSRM